jgi:hypothetical protein
MKYVLFALIVTVALFTVGCQNDNATGPIATTTGQLSKATPNTGALDLKGDVTINPEGFERGMTFRVTGFVTYDYRIVGEGTEAYMDFQINTQASLVSTNPIGTSGSVNNQSNYQIALANKQGVIYVQRDYYVPEFDSKLHVVYGIDESNRFSVQSLSLDNFVTHGKLKSAH